MTRIFVKFAAALTFACASTAAFAHAQLEKATPGRRRHGCLGERNPARIQRGRRAEIL